MLSNIIKIIITLLAIIGLVTVLNYFGLIDVTQYLLPLA